MTINEINTETTEGKLLAEAIFILHGSGPPDMKGKSGDEILAALQPKPIKWLA